MVSDPVRGVARRHGSINVSEVATNTYDINTWNKLLNHTASYKTFTFFINTHEYDLIYPTAPDTQGLLDDVPFYCVDRETGDILEVKLPESDALITVLKQGGVSAICNIGKFVFVAGNYVNTAYTTSDEWSASSNHNKLAAWVRGGAYNRKFTLTLSKADGTTHEVSYTTVSSGYPGTLDTSDILTSDPDYQKKVNDRVNAYNSQVTAWITTSSQDIVPANIATKLRDALVADGITASVVDSTVVIETGDWDEIHCLDGGDNTLIRGVGNEVTAAELVSTIHHVGKIIKVRPKRTNGDDGFYLKAIADDGVSTGWAQVHWQECAGVVSQPTSLFAIGTVAGGKFWMAGSPEALDTLMETSDTPKFSPSTVGDLITAPLPEFFGKRIDYLGDFQDRLVVGSGSTLTMSKTGDYFNFFRSSVLTVLDSDPIELYALGSQGDTIKSSVTFDRNVILFGERRQYSLNGRQTMTPANASIVASSYYEDAIDCDPVASGNFVFYCSTRTRKGTDRANLFQIQIGQVVDSPESYDLSGVLDDFLDGSPVELVTVTKPNVAFLRTTTSRNGLYSYTYLDSPSGSERVFDAWNKWEWSPSVGYQIGMSRYKGDLWVYMLKEGKDDSGTRKIYFSVEQFPTASSLSDKPYLDSLRIAGTTRGFTESYINEQSTFLSEVYAAIPAGTSKQFLGTSYANIDQFFSDYPAAVTSGYAGIHYNAFVTPTNPYVRDKNDKAVVNGRLTITRFLVSVSETGGCTITVLDSGGTNIATTFNGRLVDDVTAAIGTQPIVDTVLSAVVGREIREFSWSIYANKWLPLTITGIEWVGQFFNNVRRV